MLYRTRMTTSEFFLACQQTSACSLARMQHKKNISGVVIQAGVSLRIAVVLKEKRAQSNRGMDPGLGPTYVGSMVRNGTMHRHTLQSQV
jgi:hypothetical protein